MKKVFAFLLAVLITATVFAGGGGEKKAPSGTAVTTKTIGFAHYYRKDSWNAALWNDIISVGESRGYKVLINDGDANSQKQIEQIENMVNQGAEMIGICPIDNKGIVSTIDSLISQKIPVLCYAIPPAGGDIFTYVGWDFKAQGAYIGEAAAKYIKANLGGKATVAMLDVPDSEDLAVRAIAFKEVMAREGINVTYVEAQNYKSQPDLAVTVMENVLQKNSNIDIVYTAQEAGAFGARTALQTAGSKAKIFSAGGGSEGQVQEVMAATNDSFVAQVIVDTKLYAQGIWDAIDLYYKNPASVQKVINADLLVLSHETYGQVYGN
jgi:ribose transport system substrate-binding protein